MADLTITNSFSAGTAIVASQVNTNFTDITTWANNAPNIGASGQTTTMDGRLTVTEATQLNSTLTVGVNDTGYDVKFFGATSGTYLLWDESADELTFVAADLDMDDASVIRLGTDDDLLIYASGANSFVDHSGDGDMWVRALGTGEDLYLEADTDVVIRTGATPAARLTVTQAGNVGIGKTPSVALDVSGTIDSTVNPPPIVETFASQEISASGTTVTFTSSRFASAPNVMVTQANSGGGASKVPNVDNISASSCRVFLLNTSNSFVTGDASLLATLEV